MKRFIDLRGQGTNSNFAWYDTIKDIFEEHSGCQDWYDWNDFKSDFKGKEIERYKALCPEWIFYVNSDITEYMWSEQENWGDIDQVSFDFEDYNTIRLNMALFLSAEIQEKSKMLNGIIGRCA